MKKIAALFLLLLSGCANQALLTRANDGVSQNWEAHKLNFETTQYRDMYVAVIPMTGQSSQWRQDARGYFAESSKGQKMFLRRKSWDTYLVSNEGVFTIASAVLNGCENSLFLLFPDLSAKQIKESYILVASGSQRKALLVSGPIVDIDMVAFQNDPTYRAQFMKKNPSKVSSGLINLAINTGDGKLFQLMIKKEFPYPVEISGRTYAVNDQAIVAARVFNNASFLERLMQRNLTVGLPSPNLYLMGIQAIINVAWSIPEGKFNGSYFEAKQSAEEKELDKRISTNLCSRG
ncbi:MAG: hypothetical protein KC736_02305 [Candidatus Moranbacteria bacterium]|nr:hypothetical protein [Candidatus Moranbacteria bacterium]